MTPGHPIPTESGDGSKFTNSKWDYSGECKPRTERVRTVYLPAGIEYFVTWYARAGCSDGSSSPSALVFYTKKIKVPSGVSHESGEFIKAGGGSAVIGSGQAEDFAPTPSKYTYYVVRCDCSSGGSFYAKAPTAQWADSIYENDNEYWNKSAKKWRKGKHPA
jgi:hypothetical protein